MAAPDLKMLFANFENFGDNCEFGIAQRFAGIEPLGLFRFAGTAHLPSITKAVRSGFHSFGIAEDVELFGEEAGHFSVHIKSAHMIYATPIPWSAGDKELVLRKEISRIGFLKRNLLENLAKGEKVIVRKGLHDRLEDIQAFSNALREHGPNRLLWVIEADGDHPNGSVDVLSEGIIVGRVRKFAPVNAVPDLALGDWVDLCENFQQLEI